MIESLVAALQAYAPASPEQRGAKLQMLALAEQAGSARRTHFVPGHFTASAFVRSKAGDRLLLIHHRKLRRWLQPGGHLEAGDESILAAATRELAEEVAVRAEPVSEGIFDLDIHDIPAHGVEPAHQHFDVRFLFQSTDDTIAAGDEVADARWFGVVELSTCTTDDSVRRAASALRTTDS